MDITSHLDTAERTLAGIANFLNLSGTERNRAEAMGASRKNEMDVVTLVIDGYLGTTAVWTVSAGRDGTALVEKVILIEEQHTFNHFVMPSLDSITPGRFGELICEAILGTAYIPMVSRREVRKALETARNDASYIFRHGVSFLITAGDQRWADLDDSQKWEVIEDAASAQVGHPMGHKRNWRASHVPFYDYNVYDDAYHEAAHELVSTIHQEAAR